MNRMARQMASPMSTRRSLFGMGRRSSRLTVPYRRLGVALRPLGQDGLVNPPGARRQTAARVVGVAAILCALVLWFISTGPFLWFVLVFALLVILMTGAVLLSGGRISDLWPRRQRRPTDQTPLRAPGGANGLIRVVRTSQAWERFHRIPIVIDGIEVAQLANGEDISIEAAAGPHQITAVPSHFAPNPVMVEVEEGRLHSFALTAPSNLRASFAITPPVNIISALLRKESQRWTIEDDEVPPIDSTAP